MALVMFMLFLIAIPFYLLMAVLGLCYYTLFR